MPRIFDFINASPFEENVLETTRVEERRGCNGSTYPSKDNVVNWADLQ